MQKFAEIVEPSSVYSSEHWQRLPHVMKFSGGRSSGMLLKLFLDSGLLSAERGDVIVFNNTSAEHPATYEFVRQCVNYAEMEFGIPFFWIEFTTYEDAYAGEWTRSPTFRIVNRQKVSSSNPDGYHWKGETFEELVSHQGYLPSRTTRTCTAHLKLEITSRFLAEWFACKTATLPRGHYHEASQITDNSLVQRHRANRGNLSNQEILNRRKFVRDRPIRRNSQEFADFTGVQLQHRRNKELTSSSLGDYTITSGPEATRFLSLIGLRNDERSRVYKVMARNNEASDGKSRKSTYMLDGEIILTPLNKLKVSRQDVQEYWSGQPWDLAIPDEASLSNCVFCFNKGSAELARIVERMSRVDATLPPELRSVPGTPSDIQWWIDLETRYRRFAKNKKSADDKTKVNIGMWGVNSKTSYLSIRDITPTELTAKEPANAVPCDCTD